MMARTRRKQVVYNRHQEIYDRYRLRFSSSEPPCRVAYLHCPLTGGLRAYFMPYLYPSYNLDCTELVNLRLLEKSGDSSIIRKSRGGVKKVPRATAAHCFIVRLLPASHSW